MNPSLESTCSYTHECCSYSLALAVYGKSLLRPKKLQKKNTQQGIYHVSYSSSAILSHFPSYGNFFPPISENPFNSYTDKSNFQILQPDYILQKEGFYPKIGHAANAGELEGLHARHSLKPSLPRKEDPACLQLQRAYNTIPSYVWCSDDTSTLQGAAFPHSGEDCWKKREKGLEMY